jgi:hypothetical protein
MSELKAYKAVCPRCHGESIAEVNTLIGYATVYRVLQAIPQEGVEARVIEFAGGTDVDWNSSKPKTDADGKVIYACRTCGFEGNLDQLKLVEQP